VGNDPRDRYFNVILQAKRYDEKGKYVKSWLPELAGLDALFIHHPWTKSEDLFGKSELDYPQPMVEPEYWKKHY
jgi:deoxyribodipyrimidine photo-lyase